MGSSFSSNGPKIDEGLFRVALSVGRVDILAIRAPSGGRVGIDGAQRCRTGSVLLVTLRLDGREAGLTAGACWCSSA
jgi:hypothetical protein